ncbi:MAG TPA: Holliday junction branch migration protein RuvA [Dehalococcoidia bacterium]|nr:Holliday junction branch migration protein RuvA [Dehalococcoidia bacterium]
MGVPIARIRGVVEEKGADWAIVSVGGVGLVCSVPLTAADALAVGAQASLFTHLHVREDALTLYGFATRDDLTLFEQLISVSGVGPRVALGLLSALDQAELASAIAGGRADVLRRVPGVGQKTAERIVLDLRDKVTPPAAGVDAGPRAGASQTDPEVVAALMGLGYSQREATAAAERLASDGDTPLEERVRQALRFFARA